MDIPYPRQTPNANSASSAQTSTSLINSLSHLTSSQQLPLEEGRTYPAKVVGQALDVIPKLVDQLPANAVETKAALAELQQALVTLSPDKAKQHWIIQTLGKLALIQSQEALNAQQQLTLRLSGDLLLASGSQVPLPTVNSQGAMTSTLLSAIHKIMTQQVSLETGFNTLSRHLLNSHSSSQNSSQSNMQSVSQSQATTNFLARTLIDQLPTNTALKELGQTPNQNNNAQAQALTKDTASLIKNLLQNSGLFYEKQSTQTPPPALAATRAQLLVSQLSSLLDAGALSQSGSPKPNESQLMNAQLNNLHALSGSQNNTINTASAIRTLVDKLQTGQIPVPDQTQPSSLNQNASVSNGQQASALLQLFKAPDIQKLAEAMGLKPSDIQNALSLMLNLSSSSPNSAGTSTTQAAGLLPNDLKGILLALASIASDSGKSESGLKNLPMEAFLQQQPFNFPLSSSASLARANALLSDQELTTGQLLKIMASMLNRIQFNQLNSLYQSQTSASDSNTVQSWFFEIPLANAQKQVETFNLRIDKKENDSSDQEEARKQIQWNISLTFDLEALGAIFVQASLIPPSISSIIWADKTSTLSLIKNQLPHFRDRLIGLGLEVGDLSCQKGQPKQQTTKLDRSLVDIKA